MPLATPDKKGKADINRGKKDQQSECLGSERVFAWSGRQQLYGAYYVVVVVVDEEEGEVDCTGKGSIFG